MIEKIDKVITHENFLEYAAENYDNLSCHSIEEFQDDLMRLKYIRKLCTRFRESGDLKDRLILNHIIVLSNVFGPKTLCKIIWLKMSDQLDVIKPFLIFLNLLPDKIYNINGINIVDTTLVSMDQRVIDVLRKI